MFPIRNLKTYIQLATILTIAFALKYFYSIASVNQLRWILAPTTFLVELFTGTQFRFESQAGYLSEDRSFLIAAPCSGVNFLIIAFVMLTVGRLWRDRSAGWRFLPVAMLAAYLTTLVANTTRIVVALYLRTVDTGLEYEELHRIEGIVVYFVFLLLLFLASEKFSVEAIASRSKYLLIIYYGVTLGIPIARGSYRAAEFWQHAGFVVLIPLVFIIPLAAYSAIRNRYVHNVV